MALSVRAVRSKIVSVKNIRKITKAMELVAASKMRRAVASALATRVYSMSALEILVNISRQRHVEHQLLRPPKGNKALLIIAASDKGLCGSFNVNLQKAVAQIPVVKNPDLVKCVTLGRRGEKIAKRLRLDVIGSFPSFSDSVSSDDLRGLTKLVLDEFTKGEYAQTLLAYTHYISAIKQRPIARKLLPIDENIMRNMIAEVAKEGGNIRDEEVRNMSLYLFEPGEEDVLNTVLPRLFEVAVYQGVLESAASEHSARMVAMKSASDNATDLVDELTLIYNHARQDSITREISEIAAGADALT